MTDDRPIICVDLDGVLNLFDGWKSADYFHPPRPGSAEFLEQLSRLGYQVVIFTTRWAPHVEDWLREYGLLRHVTAVTDKKPPAHVFIDDRAICFQGDFARALEQVARFRPHWDQSE